MKRKNTKNKRNSTVVNIILTCEKKKHKNGRKQVGDFYRLSGQGNMGDCIAAVASMRRFFRGTVGLSLRGVVQVWIRTGRTDCLVESTDPGRVVLEARRITGAPPVWTRSKVPLKWNPQLLTAKGVVQMLDQNGRWSESGGKRCALR